jgi:hypothetical protein
MAALAVLTLGLAAVATELALPSVAEDRVRSQLSAVGSVTSVKVSASPAVKLLFGDVESAEVQMSAATLDAKAMDPEMLDRAAGVEVLDLQVDTLHAGPVVLRSVVLSKRGPALDASATLDVDEVEQLVPGAQLRVEGGKMLLSLSKLPIPMPGPIRLEIDVKDGVVVARPLGAAALLLPEQPLLDRPDLSVTTLHSTITGGQIDVSANATLEL